MKIYDKLKQIIKEYYKTIALYLLIFIIFTVKIAF